MYLYVQDAGFIKLGTSHCKSTNNFKFFLYMYFSGNLTWKRRLLKLNTLG